MPRPGRIHIWNFLSGQRCVPVGAPSPGVDSKILRKASGDRELYISRVVNGPENRKTVPFVFAFDTFDCESRALPYLGFDCRHGISLRNCDRMMDAELACAGVLGLERLPLLLASVALARLGNEPEVRLGRLPAAGYFCFASSSETDDRMMTSSPCFQFTGVATLCVAVSCIESSTRKHFIEVAACAHRIAEHELDLLVRTDHEDGAHRGIVRRRAAFGRAPASAGSMS